MEKTEPNTEPSGYTRLFASFTRLFALILSLAATSRAMAATVTYYWVGGSTGNLTDAKNWSETRGGTALASVTINSDANLYFTTAATITLTDGSNCNYSYFEADVTFTGDGSGKYLNMTQDVFGKGHKITLAGNAYLRAASRSITIAPDLEANGTNALNPSAAYTITVTGDLTGSGTLTCNNAVNFTGDTSKFAGTLAFASTTAMATTTMTIGSSATVLIPYEDEAVEIIEGWTVNGSVKFRLSGTTTATVEANKDVKFPFSNASTVQVFTESHKAGDTLFSCSHGSASDWDASNIKVYSPNTQAASLFYGTPDIETDTSGNVVVKAKYKDNAGVWQGENGADFGAWDSWGLTASGKNDRLRNYPLIVDVQSDASAIVGESDIPSVLFLGNMELTGKAQLKPHGNCVWEGPGKVTMSGTGILRLVNSGSFTMYSDLAIAADKTFSLECANYSANLFGAVSLSSGKTLTLSDSSSKAGGVIFHGDMSGIEGGITTSWTQDASYLQFADSATNLVNATVTLGTVGNEQPLCATAGTYTFASLSGKVTSSSDAVTLVTEASSSTTISNVTASGSWTLKNAGRGDVTVESNNFATNVTSSTGAFVLPSFNGAVVVKEGTAANAKYAAVKAGENANLAGLTLALEVPDEVGGWQNLVEATSYSGNPASLVTFTKPEGREKYILKMRSDTILGATDRTGITIVIQ